MNEESVLEFDLSTLPQEVVAIENKAVSEGLGKTNAQMAMSRFSKFFSDISCYEEKTKSINITDISQKKEMKEAREMRLELKNIRVNADKVRKDLKAAVLVEGRMIDGIYNIIAGLVSPLETRLEEQEKYAERVEFERVAKVKQKRLGRLSVYDIGDSPYVDLYKMDNEAFEHYLDTCKLAYDKNIEIIKLEQERQEKELARIAEEKRLKEIEDARIREENAKLKAEAEAKEKALQEERERVEKIRLEVEAKARRELEAEREKARVREEAEAKERYRLQKLVDDENARKLEEVRKDQEDAKAKLKMGDDELINSYLADIQDIEFPRLTNIDRAVKIKKLIAECLILAKTL